MEYKSGDKTPPCLTPAETRNHSLWVTSPSNAAKEIAVPRDDCVKEDKRNFSFNQFQEQPCMDYTIKRLAGIEEAAKNTATTFNIIVDSLF